MSENINPHIIAMELNNKKSITSCRTHYQCSECGNEVHYYYRDKTYILGYCNKCGNIDLRDRSTGNLMFSSLYNNITPKFNPNYQMLLGNGEVIDSTFNPTSYKDKLEEDVEEFKENVISIVDEVISEDYCIKYCVGNRDEYCDEIDCARNKIISKLKLKFKRNGKLE